MCGIPGYHWAQNMSNGEMGTPSGEAAGLEGKGRVKHKFTSDLVKITSVCHSYLHIIL